MEGGTSGKPAKNNASRFAHLAESEAEKRDKCELGRDLSAPRNGTGPSSTENSGLSLGTQSSLTTGEVLCRAISVCDSSSARAPEMVFCQGADLYFDGEEFWDADTEAEMQCLMVSLMKNSKVVAVFSDNRAS